GVLDLVQRATHYRRQSNDLRPLAVFPLASRVDTTFPTYIHDYRMGNSEQEIIGYQPAFEELFKQIYDLPRCNLEHYFDNVQIQHVPEYAYGEKIAVLLQRSSDRLSIARSYENFTRRLQNLTGPWEELKT